MKRVNACETHGCMKAVYPGSFDPLHNGHLDIIRRSRSVCDHLTVAVLDNSLKSSKLLTPEVRVQLIREAAADLKNVKVETFSGLLTDYARANELQIIIKSLRGAVDLEYEAQMARLNRMLYPDAETLFLLAAPEWSFVSSTRVRELARLGADVSGLVPAATLNALLNTG